jgi:hypothetical protein
MSPSDLEHPILLSLVGGGFAAAFLHAALPTHWLPFVLVGRAQQWTLTRNLAAVTAAGLAHVASTVFVGSLIVAAGMVLDTVVSGLLPWLSAGLLFVFGGFYLIRAIVRRPVVAGGPGMELAEPSVSHAAAFWGLVGMLALLTLAFALGTVLGMTVFTLLARAGASILRLERWARYEGAVLGLALIVIGLLIVTHQH